ncbi:MAG: hypothetical protein DSY37_02560 [Hyperthermus sp.]|nr:MAG: hypothetical protein DSY37_02560 [Hyperthermus sp.]
MARRSRRRSVAIIMASGFIALLFLEILAIFSPALSGLLGRGGKEHYVLYLYAPRDLSSNADSVGRALADSMSASYVVHPVNVTGVPAIALVVKGDKGPLVLTLIPPISNSSMVSEVKSYVTDLVRFAHSRLMDNETLLYIGGTPYRLPRNMSYVEDLAKLILSRMAANMSPPGAGGG